ncbi:uncharacterized protein [Euphorbia lathyris]|uniref:uncharacterized protein n=1 Tax=Euphorbia lathyris TaxID=212925 RepID=UPI0033141713
MAIISASKTLSFNATFDYSNPIGIVETLFDFLANESDFLDKDNADGEIAAVGNAARHKVKRKKAEEKEREAALRKSRMKDEPMEFEKMEESCAREPLNSRLVKIVSIERTVDSVSEERLSNLEKSVQGIADQAAIIIAKMNDDGFVRKLRLNMAVDVGMKREKRQNLEEYTDYINKKFEQEKEREELLKRDIIEQVRDGLSSSGEEFYNLKKCLSGSALPPKFKLPKMKKFDGTGDPSAHIYQYIGVMKHTILNEEQVLELFNIYLEGAAFIWFHSLPATTKRDWKELA